VIDYANFKSKFKNILLETFSKIDKFKNQLNSYKFLINYHFNNDKTVVNVDIV
jgi:hypothetical protein